MKIGLVGATYQQTSLPFDAQRSINLYAVMDQTGKEVGAMYGTPGLILFGTLGSAPMRGEFTSTNGRAFAVCGSNLFEVAADGTGSLKGTLNFSAGTVLFAENPTQLGICDGVNVYMFNYVTGAFKQIIGGLSYVTNGSFSVGTGWTLGSGWSIAGGFANAIVSSALLSQTSPAALVSGTTYTLQYTIGSLPFVSNGTFNGATGWTAGSGWTIVTGQANAVTATSNLSQTSPNTLVSGQTYNVTFTVTRTAGSVAVSLGGGTAGASISASSTVTQVITAGATQVVNFAGTAFSGSVSNITISIVNSGTVTASIGGVSGITRTTPGTYLETIVAGASQTVAFTGAAFTGSITGITITDPAVGLPASCGTITFLDGFFLVSKNNTGSFFKSAANDGTSWNALDFSTAESSPDYLGCIISAIGQAWLMGSETGEIWTNTGAASFPFQKISGGKMTMGIFSNNSAIELDNTLFWVGGNKHGFAGVFRANGFIPKKISTAPIDAFIRQATDAKNIRSYAYEHDDHLFLVLTGGGLATSLTYDVTTDMWHERAYLNSQGVFEQHLGCCYMNAFGQHIVGDRNNGNMYILDAETYTDNGDPLAAERIYTHLSDESKRIRYNNLVVGVESGVGLQSGQGSDPLIELQLSVDGARTWSDSYFEEIGKVGQYKNKAQFRRLGVAEIMTFKIRITDPVKRSIVGSYLE